MRRALTITISIILVVILLCGAWTFLVYGNLKLMQKAIKENSDHTYGFSYSVRSDSCEILKLKTNREQTISLHYWKMNLLGKVKIIIEDETSKNIVYCIDTKNGLHKERIKLNEGKFNVKVDFKSVMGGFVLGYNRSTDTLFELRHLTDTDQDGLPDAHENEYKTDIASQDTDGDGLSDYDEIVKYRTNPLSADSDEDGIPDSAWEERREYTYTIQAVVDLNVPHRIEDMNDLYQDARILKANGRTSRIEVVLFPEAEPNINPSEYFISTGIYTKPTYTKNYSEEMKESIRDLVKESKTDIQAVIKIIKELKSTEYLHLIKDLKMDSDMPMDFSLVKGEHGKVAVLNERKSQKYSIEEIKEKVLFADSMYKNKTRGACGSTAILRGAMLRAAGLEERSIFTIPLFYSLKSDNLVMKVKDDYVDTTFLNLPDSGEESWVDHVLNEVLIGNRWIQVDFGIDTGYRSLNSPKIKTICFNDPTEIDFANDYSKLDFYKERPYKYISVIEQDKKY